MGVTRFEEWADKRVVKSMPITCLADSVVGFDASYYLDRLLSPAVDSVSSALGGWPLGLESNIVKELRNFQQAGITPHFVFNGLDSEIRDDPFGPSLSWARTNAQAFEIYEKELPGDAIEMFKRSGSPNSAALVEFLKKILYEQNVTFTTAPYSALAQLAYYRNHPSQFVDAVYGPPELFLYGVDKPITRFDLTYELVGPHEKGTSKKTTRFLLEASVFRWIDRQTCLDELGRISPDLFDDALLLAGSRLLRRFPPLENQAIFGKTFSIPDTVNLIMSSGRSVAQLCNQYSGDPLLKELDYLDNYRRVVTSVKHHIIITKDGDIEPMDKDRAPSDVHDCVGQRLPEELNMYLSRGMVRSRVLNWLASGKVLVAAPNDGGDSVSYQNLVRTQLEPLRKQALSLLADSLNRYYQRKEITTRYWFDHSTVTKFNIKDLLPSPKDSIAAWNASAGEFIPGSLSFAIRSLGDSEFAARTVTPKSTRLTNTLKTIHEIKANTVWRFLQLRGYIDRQHQLTFWGKVLETVLSTVGHEQDQEKAAILAVELMRFDLLTADTMFTGYSGAPMRGTDLDKRNCMLVSRVACLGKIHHQSRGYSGPLSRHMLAYYSIVSVLQAHLRDLVEMSLVTMFLEGLVDREREDWMEISLGLPFYTEHSCALGVVMMTYLDELCTREDPTSEVTREEMKIRTEGWFEYCDFAASQKDAFHLWNAVYQGVKMAGKEVKAQNDWDEVNHWLSQRR
ncbi:MAG: hypothetical protein LQ342_002971 [Letrouitia transgressa]|nr:MAG: hypothetical protein LQ342_002971 [Letrouitia transgressa]